MITCRLYRDGKVAEEKFEPSRISDVLTEERTMVWLDLEDPSDADLAMLEEEFSLPRLDGCVTGAGPTTTG
ncbi:MAG: hypothetical protein ACRDH8_01945 [Actinomycetota bacterium]